MLYDKLKSEVWYEFTSSSGPGGQHVNRNRTKATLCFMPLLSGVLSPVQKMRIKQRLSSKISNDGMLRVSCEVFRTQPANKKQAYDNFITIISDSLKTTKKRRPTSPSRSGVERRLKQKKIRSAIKKIRQRDEF